MKKIILILLICPLLGCSGYKPLFSTNNFDFHIEEIINVNNDQITRNLKKKVKNYSVENKKKSLTLKINSEKQESVISKDSKGDPLIFEIILKSIIEVIHKNEKISNFTLTESFTYNNQSNKFEMSQYKKNVENELLNKIVENLILNLQSL